MNNRLRMNGVMALGLTMLLAGCGGGEEPAATTPAGSGDPAALLPDSEELQNIADTATDQAEAALGAASATVQGWIDEYDARIAAGRAFVDEYKGKIERSNNEDLNLLYARVEPLLDDIAKRVRALATVSEVEARARKLGIDPLFEDLENMIAEIRRQLA